MIEIPILTKLNEVDSPGPKMVSGWRERAIEAKIKKGKEGRARSGAQTAKLMGRRDPT